MVSCLCDVQCDTVVWWHVQYDWCATWLHGVVWCAALPCGVHYDFVALLPCQNKSFFSFIECSCGNDIYFRFAFHWSDARKLFCHSNLSKVYSIILTIRILWYSTLKKIFFNNNKYTCETVFIRYTKGKLEDILPLTHLPGVNTFQTFLKHFWPYNRKFSFKLWKILEGRKDRGVQRDTLIIMLWLCTFL